MSTKVIIALGGLAVGLYFMVKPQKPSQKEKLSHRDTDQASVDRRMHERQKRALRGSSRVIFPGFGSIGPIRR